PGDLDRDHRSRGDQIHADHRSTGGEAMRASILSDLIEDLAAPPAPATLDATGIHVDQLEQLLVKTLYGGEITGLALSERLRLRAGFAHLVVNEGVLEQLGPAINANKAIFLYGPPGNGKTVIGEGIGRAMGGDMYIPYALDIDGSIVRLFDPATHESLEAEDPH